MGSHCPFGELAAAGFPKLVISGGRASVFEAVCDTLADLIKAGRAIVPGRHHTILPAVGEAYNSRVHEFLSQKLRPWLRDNTHSY